AGSGRCAGCRSWGSLGFSVAAAAGGLHHHAVAGPEDARLGGVDLLAVDEQAPGLARRAAREPLGQRFQLRHEERAGRLLRVGHQLELEADALAAAVHALAAAAAPDLAAKHADRRE